MKDTVINVKDKLEQIHEHWTPKIVEQMNNYQIKLAKFKGPFTWHVHGDTDELFYIVKGQLTIEFENHKISLNEGELYVVQKGLLHRPVAEHECEVLLMEPKGTKNTGEVVNDQTASNTDWI